MTIPTIAILLLLLVTMSLANEDDDKAEQESLAMIILLSAGSLAWSFFRLVWSGIYSVICILLLPVYYILSFFWQNLVARPFALFLHITHALYPVAMYCLAAVCCGTVIGGCAGFAAEAVSTFTIRTTWGRPDKRRAAPAIQRPPRYDDDDDTASYISEVSSQWDPTYFGEHQNKGKERAVVDSWRQSLEPMYMSSTRDDEEPLDDWAWDDEDDDMDDFPRLRRRSVVR
ncbi:hypothetical protein BJV82DRAFT_589752 [Fennellomyces sp. T-0311]|nr:hypothetical protein BJV82DRAFT_589752 [Fennellomyces sp. T-0311]